MRVAGGRPDGEARPVEEAGVDRDERAVSELVLEDLGVGVQLVPLELGEVGLDVLVECDGLRAKTWFSVSSEIVESSSRSSMNQGLSNQK